MSPLRLFFRGAGFQSFNSPCYRIELILENPCLRFQRLFLILGAARSWQVHSTAKPHPAGHSGRVKPIAPATATTTKSTAIKARSNIHIGVSGHGKPCTPSCAAPCHGTCTLRACSVSTWHTLFPFFYGLCPYSFFCPNPNIIFSLFFYMPRFAPARCDEQTWRRPRKRRPCLHPHPGMENARSGR